MRPEVPRGSGGQVTRREGRPPFAGMTAGAFPDLVAAGLAAAPTAPGERLRRLTLLHTAGALTDREYVEAREAILRGRRP